MNTFEETYGKFLRFSFSLLNPFKKAIIKTQCEVHKHLNHQAINILDNDGYKSEASFYRNYIESINKGAVWADQDFKSSQHFYNPRTNKGMYGRKNASDLGLGYYEKAINLWEIGDYNKALFNFGAALHILQDMTIPQHANVKLLDDHRQYETFVKRTYKYIHEFRTKQGGVYFDEYSNFIKFNAKTAMKIYKRFKTIEEDEKRFYHITKCILPLAARTTAGCMLMFYNQVFNKNIEKLN